MDGTLLGPDSLVSAESAELITELSKRGFPVTVATARTPATVDVLLENTYTDIPAIVMTGAALWERNMDRYINPVLFDEDIARELLAAFAESGVHPFIYVLGDDGMLKVYHNGKMDRHELKFYEERADLGLKRFILDSPEGDKCPIPGTILVFAMGDAEAIECVARQLRMDSRLSVSCYRDIFNHDIAFIEVFGAGVSKQSAVLKLAEMVGATAITVYGDNLNDLSMMEVADDSVAVANAVPAVLERAGRHIGPNTDSSVALDILKQVG